MNPSQVLIDPEGNILMAPAVLIAVQGGVTEWFQTGQGGAVAVAGIGVLQGAAGSGVSFEGGSGRNVKVTTNGASGLVDHRWFTPTQPDLWHSAFNGTLTVTRDPGTGALSLGDGTDVVADSAGGFSGVTGGATAGTFPITGWVMVFDGVDFTTWAGLEDPTYSLYLVKATGDAEIYAGGSTVVANRLAGDPADPSGVYDSTPQGEIDFNGGVSWSYTVAATAGSTSTLSSTAYGETTYNGGAPFTIDIEREAGTDWTARMAFLTVSAGTALAGYFSAVGWGGWQNVTDTDWSMWLDDTTGEGELRDATDVVMTREGGPLYNPAGAWVSTAYGEATYNGGDPFTGVAGLQRAVSLEGVVYVIITRDAGTNVASALTGPFWQAGSGSLVNTSTEVGWPVAAVDAQGVPRQLQFGPIQWILPP